MPSLPRHNRPPGLSIAWVLLLLCAGLTGRGQNEDSIVLHLQNGDRLTGRLVRESAEGITLQSAALGLVTVPAGQIVRREQAPTTPAATPAAPPPAAPPPAAPPAAAPAAPAVPAKALPPKRWNTEVQLGTNLRFTTKDQQDALALLKTTYGRDRFRETLDYTFTYGRTEGIVSANRMSGSSKSEYDISKSGYVFNLAGAGMDQIRRIDLQYELSPGLGYEVIGRSNFVFKSEIGFTYQQQFRADKTEQTTYSARLGEIFSWKIWDKLTTDARFEFFPNLETFEDYRIRLEATVRYPLLRNVSLNLVVIDLYDTAPARAVENNDLQIRSAVGLRF